MPLCGIHWSKRKQISTSQFVTALLSLFSLQQQHTQCNPISEVWGGWCMCNLTPTMWRWRGCFLCMHFFCCMVMIFNTFTCTGELMKIHLQKDESCQACGGEGDLLYCESCTYAYHPKCLLPPLKAPLPISWRCPECVGSFPLENLSVLSEFFFVTMICHVFAGKPPKWYWQDIGLWNAPNCCWW